MEYDNGSLCLYVGIHGKLCPWQDSTSFEVLIKTARSKQHWAIVRDDGVVLAQSTVGIGSWRKDD